MSRSNIGKVRLNLTKMERLRAKKAHHIENLYKQVVYLDQMISVYKEALSEEQGEQNAVCEPRGEGQVSSERTDTDSGQFNLPSTASDSQILDQQPNELCHDSGNTGIIAGSGV